MTAAIDIETTGVDVLQPGCAWTMCCIEDLNLCRAPEDVEFAQREYLEEKGGDEFGRRFWLTLSDALTDLMNEVWTGIEPAEFPSDLALGRLGITRDVANAYRRPEVVAEWVALNASTARHGGGPMAVVYSETAGVVGVFDTTPPEGRHALTVDWTAEGALGVSDD